MISLVACRDAHIQERPGNTGFEVKLSVYGECLVVKTARLCVLALVIRHIAQVEKTCAECHPVACLSAERQRPHME
jgi:hypothetical protein